MSTEANNDVFRTSMLAEIKKIQRELNELKIIKKNIVKKSTKRKASKRKVPPKRKASKRKAPPKRKASKKTAKRKIVRRKQISNIPNYLTNLCLNQYDYS